MTKPSRHIQQLFNLSGKVALVTGGAGYLGGAIAEALAELGASVVITSREKSRAEEAAGRLPRIGGAQHGGVALNQLDLHDATRCIADTIKTSGKVDILINNAHDRTIEDWKTVTPEQFARDLNNAAALFFLAREFRQHLIDRKAGGSVVNVGSMYGVVGSYPSVYEGITTASPVSYHATKGAVVHLTRHLAVYWAKDGIRVNCLCPGPFPFASADPRIIERLNERVPLGRIGQPWECKGAAAFLASEASSYVTGQVLLVDGGWTAW